MSEFIGVGNGKQGVISVSIDADGNVVTDRADNYVINTKGSGFTPSQYDADLVMDGTAQAVPLATGTTKCFFINEGATTEKVRVAFGTSAANAEANLTITGSPSYATTGHPIPSPADGYGSCVLGVPKDATHYAVANAVASDTQTVSITQGT